MESIHLPKRRIKWVSHNENQNLYNNKRNDKMYIHKIFIKLNSLLILLTRFRDDSLLLSIKLKLKMK